MGSGLRARAFLLATALLSAVALTLTAAAATPEANAVVRFPGAARHFAFDGERVAWIDWLWKLRTHTIRTGKETKLSYTVQYEEIPSSYVFGEPLETIPRLVLKKKRLLWLSLRGRGQSFLGEHVYTAPEDATAGRRLATVERGLEGGYVTGIAADALGFSFATVTVKDLDRPGSSCSCRFQVAGGRISSSIDGTLRRVRGVPPAYLLARAAGRMAIVPVETSEQREATPIPTNTVEIRNATTGSQISSFAPGRVRALALSKTTAAVLVGKQIKRYDTSGRLIGTTVVPKDTAAELAIEDEHVIFRTTHAIHLLESAAGRVSTLATTSPWNPTAVAIAKDTVAWAEARRIAPGEVNQLTYKAQIRTLALRKRR